MPFPTGGQPRRLTLLAALVAGAVLAPTALATESSSRAEPPLSGTLIERTVDDFARGRSSADYAVQTGGRVVPVRVSARKAERLVGRRVHARFGANGSVELLAAGGGREAFAAGGSSAAAATHRRVAILLVNFSNDTRQPWTREQVRSVAFDHATSSVAAYYDVSTWGRVTMSGDVFGWFTLPHSNTSCSYSTWGSSANSAAAAAGIDLNAYQHVVYAFPMTSACAWSGLAYTPGKYSWLNNAGTSLRVMSHELGHNLGAHHASALTCTVNGARVPLASSSSSCTASEYGDPFSVMGASTKHTHTNVSRGNLGLLQASNTQTVTTSGDYAIRPIDPEDTSVQSLRIPRTSTSFLVLELRRATGTWFTSYSASDPLVSGVTVRVGADYGTKTQTQLVDTTPATTSFADAPLGVGRSLTDPLTGVTITTLSVGAAGAVVRVGFGGSAPPPPDTTPPSQPGALAASALDSSRVALSWTASTDNVGVTGYRISRNGSVQATVAGTGWTDSGLAGGTAYAYTVVALDAAGNASPAASASATTLPAQAADTQPPTAPSSLSASVAKKKATLVWGAASDDVGVAGYRISRNGALVATTSGTSFTEALGGKGPSATYSVAAFDAAGNVGPSVSVHVSG